MAWFGPVVVAVHNLGAGGNTPSFWLPPPRGLGWPHAMFNAYFLRDGYRVFPGVVGWVDSGGFLFLEAPQRRLAGLHGSGGGASSGFGGWGEDLVELVLRRQEAFGARVAFTLDYPIPAKAQLEPGCCPREVLSRLRATAVSAGLAYQLRRRSSMRLLVVLQFNGLEALSRLLELLAGELRSRAGLRISDVDGFAVGGLVPVSHRWSLVAERIQLARRLLGWDVWLHVLGIASPRNIGLLYAAGADSMDSKTYIIAAAKRLYYLPLSYPRARISASEKLGLDPRKICSCPGCSRHESLGEMRRDTRSLALHNLHVALEAARAVGEACRSGRLVEYLKSLASSSPRLSKALEALRSPRKCSSGAPGELCSIMGLC